MLAVQAVPAQALDLLETYRAALAHDSVLASAVAGHRGGVEVLNQAHAQRGAVVQLNASAGLVRERPLLGEPEATSSSAQAGLSLSQPIYNRANSIAEQQAEKQVTRLDVQLSAAKQDLIVRVAQAYFNLLLAQDNLEFTESEKDSIVSQLAQAQRSFQVGTVAITDVSDAKTRFDLNVATEIQNKGDLEVARHALEVLTGLPSEHLAAVSAQARPSPPQPDDVQFWITAAEQNNLNVLQAATTLAIQQQDIQRNRAERYPSVNLVASVANQSYGNSSLSQTYNTGLTSSIGVQLTLPVWDSGMISSRTRQAVAGADQAREDLETARRSAAQSARQAYTGVNTAVAQAAALEQAIDSAQKSLEASLREREVGYRTSLDVLNSRQLLYQTRRQLATVRYTAILGVLQLKAIAGSITEWDLQGLTTSDAPPAPRPAS